MVFVQGLSQRNIEFIDRDVTKDEAETLVNKYFGDWKKKEVAEKTFSVPKAPAAKKVALVNRPNSVQSVINISYPVELAFGGEDAAKASVTNTILGGGLFQSRQSIIQ